MKTTTSVLGAVGWIAVTFLAAVPGAIWPPGEWYAQLTKPAWNPPNWIFPPMWTTLYALMGIAAWRVWRHAGFAGARGALTLFLVQLAFNAAWTPVFFGLHQPAWGLIVITLLWFAIAATLIAFRRHDRFAGWLFTPYLAWVSFAAALNAALWRLN